MLLKKLAQFFALVFCFQHAIPHDFCEGGANLQVSCNPCKVPKFLGPMPDCHQFEQLNVLSLRGGATSVLPPPGPPAEDGKLKSCAQCGTLETRTTLGRCLITELYFCAKTECRKRHWIKNKDFWRDRAAKVCSSLYR